MTTKWSFDDNFIGQVGEGGRSLQSREMARMPHLSLAEWYKVAGKLCRAANAAEDGGNAAIESADDGAVPALAHLPTVGLK